MARDGTWTGCEAGGSHLPRALGRATVRAPLNAFSEMLGVGRAAPSFSRVVAAWAHGGFAHAFGDRGRVGRRPAASSEPHARSSATQPPHGTRRKSVRSRRRARRGKRYDSCWERKADPAADSTQRHPRKTRRRTRTAPGPSPDTESRTYRRASARSPSEKQSSAY